MSVHIIDHH